MKLIKTTIFSSIISIIRISSGFIANKVIAIYTGPNGIAMIGAFNNFINIVLTFSNGAINTGVVKYTSEYESDNEKLKLLFATSFKISLYCSVIVGLFLIIFEQFLSNLIFANPIYSNPIKFFGVSLIFYSLNSLINSILNGKKNLKIYTVINIIGSIISLIFTLILVYFFKINGALYALVLSQSIVFFISIFLISKLTWYKIDLLKVKINFEILKKLSNYSLMAIVSTLTVPISQIYLRNMLISTNGIQAAGIWQGLMRISDGYLLIITTALVTYYLPKLSSLNSNEELRSEVIFGYKLILPSVFITSIIIYTLRFYIIKTLYTTEFLEMSDLFIYQLIGDFFKIASWILAYLMLAKSMTKQFIITEIGSTMSYILLSYICVNNFGLKGISIAFAINYFTYFLIMLYLFRRLLVENQL